MLSPNLPTSDFKGRSYTVYDTIVPRDTQLFCYALFSTNQAGQHIKLRVLLPCTHLADHLWSGSKSAQYNFNLAETKTVRAETCPELINVSMVPREDIVHGGNFNWTLTEQGTVLGAFFYGYIITQVCRLHDMARLPATFRIL